MFRTLRNRLRVMEQRRYDSEESEYVYIGIVEKMTKEVRARIAEIQAAGDVPFYRTIVDPQPLDVSLESEVRDDPLAPPN